MTQTLNPNDTGEIVNHSQLDQARTEIIDLESTRNLAPYMAQLPPPLRIADATGEMPALREMPYGFVPPEEPPIWEPAALDDRPYPPVPPPVPPAPRWAQPASHHALVRRRLAKPKPGRGRHRAATPWWVALVLGLLVVGAAAGALSVLAVIR